MTEEGRGRGGEKEIYREERARGRHTQQQQQQRQQQVSSFFQVRRKTVRVYTTLGIQLTEKCKRGLLEGTRRDEKRRERSRR